jgi:hypothetical protein
MKAKFPPYKGEWGQEHIDWFIQNSARLTNKKTELISSAEIIQIASPKENEPNITPQKARELMQLIVTSKIARVTNGFVESTEYRIKMCSDVDCFYYLDDLFGHELLFRLYVVDLIFPKDVLCRYLEKPINDWTDENEAVYRYQAKRMRCVINCFWQYSFNGGDMGDFGGFATFGDIESKKWFLLYVNELICLYKVLKIGWEELDKSGIQSADELFMLLLEANAACIFLKNFKRYEPAPIKPSTMRKEVQKIARDLEPGCLQKLPENRTIFVMGKDYAEADDLVVKTCNFASGGRYIDELSRSENNDIKIAVDDYYRAFIAVLKAMKE